MSRFGTDCRDSAPVIVADDGVLRPQSYNVTGCFAHQSWIPRCVTKPRAGLASTRPPSRTWWPVRDVRRQVHEQHEQHAHSTEAMHRSQVDCQVHFSRSRYETIGPPTCTNCTPDHITTALISGEDGAGLDWQGGQRRSSRCEYVHSHLEPGDWLWACLRMRKLFRGRSPHAARQDSVTPAVDHGLSA